MDKNIERFILENEELIDSNGWEEIYKKSDDLRSNIGTFTETMLDAGIHPEDYLSDLPVYFLYGSNISEFKLPSNVKSIGKYAFTCCYNLMNIVIPDSIINIGDSAFEHCYKLVSIDIPDNVTEIGWHTFSNCTNLIDVTIPNSVTHIDEYAFFECKDLNITYAGTAAQWQDLARNGFQGATYTCTCSDGDIVKKKV